ncbi:MAG: ISL3 family transposase [Deinococcota bacterium]|nr:ISL3 family transposase [Deinococcota bacterium]
MVWNRFWNDELVEVEEVEHAADVLAVKARTVRRSSRCPRCQELASRRHSFYTRQLADLPCFGAKNQIRIRCQRFFCDNDGCKQQIFCERLHGVASVYARKSQRLRDYLGSIAFALGGKAGAALAEAGGMMTSGTSLLRLIRATTLAPRATPRVLGIDDWSLRKGRTYGTLLVDLEQHVVIDVLQGRDADTLATWLVEHPGVDIISRDRSGDYAQGARRGAPEAIQIADRWHLLKNTSTMVERFLTRHAAEVHLAYEATVQTLAGDAALRAAPELSLSSHNLHRVQASRRKRLERYERVVGLFQQGKSKSEIARQLGMGRATVIAYLAAGTFPERRDKISTLGILAPYVGLLQRRWLEGCRNISRLWRELQAQGYVGKRAMVKRYVNQLRRLTQAECERLQQVPFRKPSPNQLSYWLLQPIHQREPKQQRFIKAFLAECPEAQTLQRYATRFCYLLKTRQADDFPEWLKEAQTCDVLEIRNFAAHILKDRDAVHNAMKYPWSNGQLEGQVNRLKTIKRQMYGRANFDLLRARVLYRPTT